MAYGDPCDGAHFVHGTRGLCVDTDDDWAGPSSGLSSGISGDGFCNDRSRVRADLSPATRLYVLSRTRRRFRSLRCLCYLSTRCVVAHANIFQAMLIIIDMSYIGDRPKAIALLWCVTGFLGTALVAIVPYMSDHGNRWRQYFHLWTVPMIISFLLVFFLYPETYFKRPTVAFDGLILVQSATEKLTVYKDIEADSELYRELPEMPQGRGFVGCLRRAGLCRSPVASWTSMARSYLQIAFCAANPLIFWILIAAAFNFAGMMFIGATYAGVLKAAPYNLPSKLITPVNLSAAVGSLVAYPVGIVPIKKMLDVLTKRNGGVREAEHYLVGLILPIFTGAMSTLIYGLAVRFEAHFAVYYLAYGLNGFSWVTFSISTILWVTEAFPRWAAPAVAVVGGGSYLVSFSMSFVLVPWIAAHGYKLVGIELTILQVASGAIALPIAFWGKSARQAIHGRWANDRGGALRPL